MKPIMANHHKYLKLKVEHCSNLQSIWYIQTDDSKIKNRVSITNDCRLVDSKTRKPIADNVKLNVRYMLKFKACDDEGNNIQVILWDAFTKIIKKSAAFELRQFRKSQNNLSDIFATYLKILNSRKWLITIETQIYHFENNKILNFVILKIEEFDNDS